MRRGFPAAFSGLPRDLRPAFLGECRSPNLTALCTPNLAAPDRPGVFALFFGRWRPVLDLAGSHVDHQFGGLGEVPRAFGVLWGHEAEYALPRPARKPYSCLPYSN